MRARRRDVLCRKPAARYERCSHSGTVVLIQLLLPSSPAAGAAALSATHRELVERFDGLTAYVRSPAQGFWTAPSGAVELDDVVMVEVVTESFDRGWWRIYADVLAKRFAQDVIHVRAVPIEVLGTVPATSAADT
jgi:hypothetical protein